MYQQLYEVYSIYSCIYLFTKTKWPTAPYKYISPTHLLIEIAINKHYGLLLLSRTGLSGGHAETGDANIGPSNLSSEDLLLLDIADRDRAVQK